MQELECSGFFGNYLRLPLLLDDRLDERPEDRPDELLLLLLRLRVSQPFFAAALLLDVDWLEPPLRPPFRDEE